MLHTPKTLYQYIISRHPVLAQRFRMLADYCNETGRGTDWLNTGHKSLKWFILGIREELHPGELQDLFHNLLCEAAAYRGEEWLYADINRFRVAKTYVRMIPKPEFDIDDWPVEIRGDVRILINTTSQNITNLVFRDDWADAILFRSPDRSAGIVLSFQEAERKRINLPELHEKFKSRGEPWALISENLLICGGKQTKGETSLTADELLNLLTTNITEK